MPWFKVDDGFSNAKPVLRLPRRFRTAAVGLWTLAGAWSAKELTDGYVPDYLLEELAATPASARHLVECGLWENAENGWRFRGWEKYQPTREQVTADREREADRKRKWRESKRSPGGTGGGRTEGHQAESGHPDPTRPDPTRPIPPTEVSTSADAPEAPKSSATLAVLDRPDVERICTHLADRIEANGAKRPEIGKTWHDSARLLMDRDGRSEQDIHAAIDWCQADEFWRANVLSMPKLREKYETLRLQAQRKGSTTTVRRGDIDWEAAAQRAADRDAREAM